MFMELKLAKKVADRYKNDIETKCYSRRYGNSITKYP